MAALAAGKAQAQDWSKVPEVKRTKLGLYLTPKQAYDMKEGQPRKILFLDIRTRAEAMYVGMAQPVDALVPYVEHSDMGDWDAKRDAYKLDANSDFGPEVARRAAQKGLGKNDTIILICRSGDRSARAANLLADTGYTHVYSVVDGFEGDMSKDGRRSVNGWKNAGLPWGYKLEKDKMYFPH